VTGDEKDFEPSPHASTHAEMVSYAHTAIHIRRAAQAIHAQLVSLLTYLLHSDLVLEHDDDLALLIAFPLVNNITRVICRSTSSSLATQIKSSTTG
jgi:hypothetical protein